ncbi:MAG TPA: 1-(5-phosphoribosyl)-5-[(5-phosphoribosylamino)methylideneamino] imidazole-4-carboxamide isomerase [Terriglobales bacterium]|nr:1-(5-phosphoribosyl)-5-[(5-phosphoribosylamino)methylideneamino] imidazole-4-carboxamide isomerase [Terriglobales bacterium]
MLIPSIDLMGGKIVQLVQGKEKKLEFDNFDEWLARFSSFPLIQLIDLDAAMDRGSNSALIEYFVRRLPCQVGGGIRSVEIARQTLALGARRIILGSSLIRQGVMNTDFAIQLAKELGESRLVFGIDAKGGKVAIRGWREVTDITPLEMVRALEPFCSAFLYTHIDTEGTMTGLPLEPVRRLKTATTKQLIVAGGIATYDEVEHLHRIGVDAVVGMALYSGRLGPSDTGLPVNIPVSK